MPRKLSIDRFPYDVGFIGGPPIKLSPAVEADLKDILGKPPSIAFLRWYASSVGAFRKASDELKDLAPGPTAARLEFIIIAAESLAEALDELRTNDRVFIGEFATRKFLAGRPFTEEEEFYQTLRQYIADVQCALAAMKRARHNGGRMPDFPGRALALSIAEALHCEIGEFRWTAVRGPFAQVLEKGRGTRVGLRALVEWAHEQFDAVKAINSFATFGGQPE